MQPLMSADQPNDAAIMAQIDKVVQARGELEKANARFLLAIRDKLTPDQWKQMQVVREGGRDGAAGQAGRSGRARTDRGPGRPGPGRQFRHAHPPPPPPAMARCAGSGAQSTGGSRSANLRWARATGAKQDGD